MVNCHQTRTSNQRRTLFNSHHLPIHKFERMVDISSSEYDICFKVDTPNWLANFSDCTGNIQSFGGSEHCYPRLFEFIVETYHSQYLRSLTTTIALRVLRKFQEVQIHKKIQGISVIAQDKSQHFLSSLKLIHSQHTRMSAYQVVHFLRRVHPVFLKRAIDSLLRIPRRSPVDILLRSKYSLHLL